jgi:glycosyltransferase involved in cell wall biosynthesis
VNSKYVIVSPVRNEEEFLPLAVDSLAAQTIRPRQWIIVDDGSSDSTAAIARAAAREHEWIRVVQRADRGFRQPGGGVIDAFYDGLLVNAEVDWEFVVKLDGDLSFEPDYFARCLDRFARDRSLGIGGGTICRKRGSALVSEAPDDPPFHVRGATKIYRRECWDAIEGLIRAPGWDTVDEYRANMLGWTTYTFPDLKLWHHRPAGAAQGTWKNWVKNGLANYVAGYHPLFMACKCVKRAVDPPYGIVALGLMAGFVSGYFRRVPQVGDPALIQYVRQQQLRRLCLRESLWDRKPMESSSPSVGG